MPVEAEAREDLLGEVEHAHKLILHATCGDIVVALWWRVDRELGVGHASRGRSTR